MSVDVLRCRVCESDHPALANGICSRCFGPLEPVYDWDEVAALATRERIEAGPHSLWRYARAAAGRRRPRTPRAARAGRRSCRRRGSRSALGVGEVLLKLDLANPTHSFKDRVVAIAVGEGGRVRPRDALGHLDRQPRERRRRPRGRDRHARGHLLPGRARAREARGDDGLRRDDLRRARELRRLLAPRQRARRRGRLGDREREPPLVLRRGLEDARVRDLRAARLGDARRGRDADRLRRDVHEGVAGLPAVRAARARSTASSRGCTAARPRAARRSRPRSPRTGASRRCGRTSIASSIAIGNPADGDLAIATARASGGGIYAVPEDEIGPNISLLAETGGIFGEGATGVAVGALREAVRRGEVGEDDRVVLLVTGTGLKTPQLAEASGTVVEIDAGRRRAARRARSDWRDRRTGSPRSARRSPRSTASCSTPSTGGSSSCGDLHEHKAAEGLPLRDPAREDVARARAPGARTPGRSPTAASPSSSGYVLDLTRTELHGA